MPTRVTATFTINLNDKSITCDRSVLGFRETLKVVLTGTGVSAFAVAGLRLWVVEYDAAGTLELKAQCASWTVDGSTFYGDLNLNTDELETDFTGAGPGDQKPYFFEVWDTTNNAKLAQTVLPIQNSAYQDGMASPSPAGSEYVEKEPTGESNWIVKNGRLCFYDPVGGGYRALYGAGGTAVFGEIET
jgi:hypothetical protein